MGAKTDTGEQAVMGDETDTGEQAAVEPKPTQESKPPWEPKPTQESAVVGDKTGAAGHPEWGSQENNWWGDNVLPAAALFNDRAAVFPEPVWPLEKSAVVIGK